MKNLQACSLQASTRKKCDRPNSLAFNYSSRVHLTSFERIRRVLIPKAHVSYNVNLKYQSVKFIATSVKSKLRALNPPDNRELTVSLVCRFPAAKRKLRRSNDLDTLLLTHLAPPSRRPRGTKGTEPAKIQAVQLNESSLGGGPAPSTPTLPSKGKLKS